MIIYWENCESTIWFQVFLDTQKIVAFTYHMDYDVLNFYSMTDEKKLVTFILNLIYPMNFQPSGMPKETNDSVHFELKTVKADFWQIVYNLERDYALFFRVASDEKSKKLKAIFA